MPDRNAIWRVLKDYAIVLLAPVALFLPMLIRGQVLFWGTPALQFVPWWIAAWHSLQQGILPLWNPLNGMGAPLLANYQLAFFYPPNWILLLLAWLGGPEYGAAAVASGFSLLAILHLAWAGLGMAFLLRRLGFPWLAQVLGGIAFGLSGYIVGRLGFFSMVWAAAWLPWVIYFADFIASPVDRIDSLDHIRPVLQPGLTVCFTLQLLSGHAQITWYTILLAIGWVTVGAWRSTPGMRWPKGLLMAWISLGAALLLAAGLAMIQLAPTFEYLRSSHRADAVAYEVAMTYSFWPWRLISLFSPDFFGNPMNADYWGYATYWEDHAYAGLVPLFLAVSTFWLLIKRVFQKRRPARWRLLSFLWALVFIAFFLAFGKNTPVFPFLYRYVPTFSMFQAPTRYLLWVAFAIPILAAIGIEHWRCPTGRGLYWFRLGTAGAFAITLGAGLTFLMSHDIRLTFIRATALTGIWALGFGLLTLAIPFAEKNHRKMLWQWMVIAWTMLDILFTGWSLNTGITTDFYIGKSAAWATVQSIAPGQRIFLSSQEENDLKFQRFLRFKDYTKVEDWENLRKAIIPDINLLDGIATTGNFDPLVPDRYGRWMKLIESLTPETRAGWLAWMGVGAIEHIDASQTNGVRFDPLSGARRWHWSSCARFIGKAEQSWSELAKEISAPPQNGRIILIEGNSVHENINCFAIAIPSITLSLDQPNRVVFEINALSSGWFELVDSSYPGWIARIDGKETLINIADGNFRAIYVPSGQHHVEFLYHPSGFYFGELFSILVMLFVILLGMKSGRILKRGLSFH